MFINNKGQAAATILAVIGIVVVGALIWWAFTAEDTNVDIDDGQDQDEQVVEVPADWEMYVDEQLNFSIAHPPEATVSEETEGRVQFTFLGPDNVMGSEITDGFTLTVASENYSQAASFQAYVEQQYDETLQNIGEGVEEPFATTFHDRAAYRYVVDTGFGPTTHLYVAHNVGTTLHLSWNVDDPNSEGYLDTVDTMLRSLNLQASSSGVALFDRVNIALLNTEPEGEPERGCDDVVLVERQVTQTTQPLNAALTELFRIDQENVNGLYHFIARTNDTLTFERATVENGTANIYLTGELSGLQGVCDNPRAKIQIEETALQYSTVNNVQIFLNDEETELQPSEQGE